jgi:branched chain amino acid efflux pump
VSAPGAPDDGAARAVLRDALGVGVATGAYAISFGAVATASGLTVTQTCAMSVLMFTGASQFAFVGVIGGGGAGLAAATTALLLGSRNALYGLRLAPTLGARGVKRLVGAQLVLDESTAMSVTRNDPRLARLGFWSTGLAVFVLWNAGTLVGALGASAVGDPRAYGLDAAFPAAFLALMWPRLNAAPTRLVALLAAAVALVAATGTPAGVPVLLAAAVAVPAVLLMRRRATNRADGP